MSEELEYGLACMLEALRQELRACSRRRDDCGEEATHHEGAADKWAADGLIALQARLSRKEAGS